MASVLAAVALASGLLPVALAQTPLSDKRFEWNNLPYQADTDDGERGRQYGYNICNSTTEGPESLCQTAVVNSIDDFCLWGPPEPDSLIGNTEGEAVAWCTKPGYGTRIIPEGALTGVQFIKTADYVQITGLIKQDLINIAADDSGGEMDPHGADQRGNPLGGLVFSNAYNGQFQQVIEWHNFMGGSAFCMKACDPSGANARRYCEHIYDRIGCKYNAPANYAEGEFLSCDGESQDFPGIYTDSAGAVQTYTQPPESLGEISSMPYEPRIPSTSNCQTYESSALFTGAAANTRTSSSSAATSTGTTTRTRTSTGGGSASTDTATNDSDGAASPRAQIFTSIAALFGVAFIAGVAL